MVANEIATDYIVFALLFNLNDFSAFQLFFKTTIRKKLNLTPTGVISIESVVLVAVLASTSSSESAIKTDSYSYRSDL